MLTGGPNLRRGLMFMGAFQTITLGLALSLHVELSFCGRPLSGTVTRPLRSLYP